MEKVYIVAAKRTAIGKFLGSLSTIPVASFGAKVVETKDNKTETVPALTNDKDIIALRHQAETEGKLNLKIFDALVRSYTPANKETLIKIIKSKM